MEQDQQAATSGLESAALGTPQNQTEEYAAARIAKIFGDESLPEKSEKAEANPDQSKAQPEEVEAKSLNESGEPDSEAQKQEATPEETKEQDANKEAEVSLSTVSELAEATGLDLDTILGLKVQTKVDGQVGEASLSQLLKSHQLEGHLTKEQQKVSEMKKALELEKETRLKALDEKLRTADAVVEALEKQIMGEFQSVNWLELRQTDPAEFAARKQEYSERYQQIEQLKHGVRGELQRLGEEGQSEAIAAHQKYIQEQALKASEHFPELASPEKAVAFKSEIKNYLQSSYGYTEAEIESGVVDHRQLLVIHKAMLYDRASKKSEVVKKKVATLPKVLKPGVLRSAKEQSNGQLEALKERLKKTGKREDAASVIRHLL